MIGAITGGRAVFKQLRRPGRWNSQHDQQRATGIERGIHRRENPCCPGPDWGRCQRNKAQGRMGTYDVDRHFAKLPARWRKISQWKRLGQRSVYPRPRGFGRRTMFHSPPTFWPRYVLIRAKKRPPPSPGKAESDWAHRRYGTLIPDGPTARVFWGGRTRTGPSGGPPMGQAFQQLAIPVKSGDTILTCADRALLCLKTNSMTEKGGTGMASAEEFLFSGHHDDWAPPNEKEKFDGWKGAHGGTQWTKGTVGL